MAANLNKKRKLTREEKAIISPILRVLTKTEIAKRAELSRFNVTETTTSWWGTPLTIEKLNKVAEDLKNSNTIPA